MKKSMKYKSMRQHKEKHEVKLPIITKPNTKKILHQ